MKDLIQQQQQPAGATPAGAWPTSSGQQQNQDINPFF